MENLKALLEISAVIFGVIFSFAVVSLTIFRDRCEQDSREDDAVFWERFNYNLEKHKPN